MKNKLWKMIIFVVIATFCIEISSSPALAIPFLSPDVLIDVGHGGIDGGSSQDQWLEKDINLQMAKLLEQSLRQFHIRTTLDRGTDRALSDDNHWLRSPSRHLRDLSQRGLAMAELDPKLIVSLHCNWSENPSQRGPVILYQSNSQSYALAQLMQKHLNALYHTARRPVYGKTFYILNYSPRPTVIVEMGFLSNPSDLKMLTARKSQGKLVQAMRSAIWEYLLLIHINQELEAN